MGTKHFREGEFACKDGCGLLVVKPLLLERLEILRALVKRPIPIVSGFRCCPHNRAVGGALRSRHTVGEAADIPASLRVTERMARECGFGGIGLRHGVVIHVDVRATRFPDVWNY